MLPDDLENRLVGHQAPALYLMTAHDVCPRLGVLCPGGEDACLALG
jgi:hypothetical protein